VYSITQLHQSDYDTGRALQALVKVINPKSIDKRWSDDDAVRALVFSLYFVQICMLCARLSLVIM